MANSINPDLFGSGEGGSPFQGFFLGLIWCLILAPSKLKNEQKLSKMVYIIPNFLVLHFGENFMKIGTKITVTNA